MQKKGEKRHFHQDFQGFNRFQHLRPVFFGRPRRRRRIAARQPLRFGGPWTWRFFFDFAQDLRLPQKEVEDLEDLKFLQEFFNGMARQNLKKVEERVDHWNWKGSKSAGCLPKMEGEDGNMTGLRAFLKDEMLSDVDLPVVESFDVGYSRMSLLFLFFLSFFLFGLSCVVFLFYLFFFLVAFPSVFFGSLAFWHLFFL